MTTLLVTAPDRHALDELVLGFVQAKSDFTIPMCEGAVKYAEQLGLRVASTGVFTVAKVI